VGEEEAYVIRDSSVKSGDTESAAASAPQPSAASPAAKLRRMGSVLGTVQTLPHFVEDGKLLDRPSTDAGV